MLSALISLEVTVDDGNNYNSTYTKPGQAQVSKLDCFYKGPEKGSSCPKTLVTNHARAHIFGELARETPKGTYNAISDLLKQKQDYPIWSHRTQPEFAHRFNEYNESDTQKAYPHFTERVITSSSGMCMEYNVSSTGSPKNIGRVSATELTYNNQKIHSSIIIPNSAFQPGHYGTTYIYRGFKVPAAATDTTNVVCGTRCMYVWVLQDLGESGVSKLYQCPITISNVTNAKLPQHNIPDSLAKLLAVSIALQGQAHYSPKNVPNYQQFEYYAQG